MPTNKQKSEVNENYCVTVCDPEETEKSDLAACLEIVESGAAVAPKSAARKIPLACAVAIARKGNLVVGTGATKRALPEYNKTIEQHGGVTLTADILELGYIAIELAHRGRGLSKKIIFKLLDSRSKPLFATTDDDRLAKIAHCFKQA